MEEETRPYRYYPDNKQKIAKVALMVLGAAMLFVLGGAGVLYAVRKNPQLSQKLGIKTQEQINQAEVESLVKEVGKIMKLPEGETPTMATVTELDKVKDQPFFKDAQNGDKVLIYTSTKRAILYRPSEKRIIEVGIVNLDQQKGQTAGATTENIETVTPSPNPTASPKPTVFAPTKAATPTLTPTPTE